MNTLQLKKKLVELLKARDLPAALAEVQRHSGRLVINPLISFLYHTDSRVKWGAVSLLGEVAATIADRELESARVLMRRFMWSLNDESGGIGWGAPEAMAEIMALHSGLAAEYCHILISYMREDGSYLELEALQRGLMWGIGRLALVRPELLRGHNAIRYLLPYLSSPDPVVRGLAAYGAGKLKALQAVEPLQTLTDDGRTFEMYEGRQFVFCRVGDLACRALQEIKAAQGNCNLAA